MSINNHIVLANHCGRPRSGDSRHCPLVMTPVSADYPLASEIGLDMIGLGTMG